MGMCPDWGVGLALEGAGAQAGGHPDRTLWRDSSISSGLPGARGCSHTPFLPLWPWVGGGASWATVEELRFGPKAHGALRLRDQCRWAVRDRTVMLRTHLSGPTRLLRKMNW